MMSLVEAASRPTVWVADPLPAVCEQWLKLEARLVSEPGPDIAGMVVRTATQVDVALLDRLPDLRCVARAGVGVDHIDLGACKKRGISVVNTPDANTESVVEYALGLLLDTVRPRDEIPVQGSLEAWESARQHLTGGRRLAEYRIGILGFGRIGQRLGAVLHALGADVAFHDIRVQSEMIPEAIRSMPREKLFSWAEILSVHIDGRAENRGLIDGPLLDLLDPCAVVLNTSRGFVFNTSDLQRWLERHPHATAILDVHSEEPVPVDHPLRQISNARLLPHLASRTQSAVAAMGWVVRDLMAVLKGFEPVHRIC